MRSREQAFIALIGAAACAGVLLWTPLSIDAGTTSVMSGAQALLRCSHAKQRSPPCHAGEHPPLQIAIATAMFERGADGLLSQLNAATSGLTKETAPPMLLATRPSPLPSPT